MVKCVEIVSKPKNRKQKDNEPTVLRVSNGKREWEITVFYIPWTTHDPRYIVADKYKRIFGLYRIGTEAIEGLKDGLIASYNENDIPLSQIEPYEVSEGALQSIRATFAFRLVLGMRCNNENTIVLRNKYPLSKRDLFWNYGKLHYYPLANLEANTYKKWFSDHSNPLENVKHFPIWRRKTSEQRLEIFYELTSILYDIAEAYECIYLYNYTVKMLRRALLLH